MDLHVAGITPKSDSFERGTRVFYLRHAITSPRFHRRQFGAPPFMSHEI